MFHTPKQEHVLEFMGVVSSQIGAAADVSRRGVVLVIELRPPPVPDWRLARPMPGIPGPFGDRPSAHCDATQHSIPRN